MPKSKVDAASVRSAEDAVRELKNWLFVFAKEYDIPKEAVDTLQKKIDELAMKIGNIECK